MDGKRMKDHGSNDWPVEIIQTGELRSRGQAFKLHMKYHYHDGLAPFVLWSCMYACPHNLKSEVESTRSGLREDAINFAHNGFVVCPKINIKMDFHFSPML